MRIPLFLCGLGLGVGLLAGGACQPVDGQNTETGTSEGSETGGCTPGFANCACAEGNSCEPGLLCASQKCVPDDSVTTSETTPPLTTTLGTSDTGEQTETSGDSTGSSGTGTPLDCDPKDPRDPACSDPGAPYCGAQGTCVACDAIDCSGVSPATPICDAASGSCVQCSEADASACGGVTPVCDAATSSCIACTDHAQCKDSACQLETGACFASVLHVDRGSPCDGADGSIDLPFCEIQDAVAKVGADEPTAILVKPNIMPYSEQVQVPSGRTLAIVRNGNGVAKLEVGALDSLTVNDDATVYLDQLQISKGDVSKGIFCKGGAKVWVDRTQIVDRKGLGVEGLDCALHLRQSRIYLNLGGGLKLTGGSAHLENSFIVSNGGSFANVSGVVLSNGATLDAVYTTIADNDGKAGIEDSLDCINQGAVTLRNSIVFGQSDATSVSCPMATAPRSVVDATALMGEGTIVIKALEPTWFVMPESGNFQIKGGAPLQDVATWQTGDPATDYDGDPRPGNDGDPDYVGADRPK